MLELPDPPGEHIVAIRHRLLSIVRFGPGATVAVVQRAENRTGSRSARTPTASSAARRIVVDTSRHEAVSLGSGSPKPRFGDPGITEQVDIRLCDDSPTDPVGQPSRPASSETL